MHLTKPRRQMEVLASAAVSQGMRGRHPRLTVIRLQKRSYLREDNPRSCATLRQYLTSRYPTVAMPPELAEQFEVFDLRPGRL